MKARRGSARAGPVGAGEGGALVRVRVQPGSSAPGVEGLDPWRNAVVVRVAAPARDGKANEELRKRVAEGLGVDARSVTLVSGHRSRDKVLRVEGLGADEVERRLGGPG